MTRIVVVGHGMVGHRFLDELASRGLDVQVTVLAAEEALPYNRVLLSEVVAGRYQSEAIVLPKLSASAGEVQTGRRAVAIDRERRVVRDDAGAEYGYDALVLATGARARMPELDGLSDLPIPAEAGIHVLRDLSDATDLLAQIPGARRATVVGGGVLGLEIALGLAGHGVVTTIVHGGTHLMDRQLAPGAGAAAENSLAKAGVKVVAGSRPTAVGHEQGRVTSLTLADGTQVLTDLVVMAAGTVVDTEIVRAAGLPVSRGIVVGNDLASPGDPRVFAIGDCAQPPQGSTGLVAQGWEQARRLATILEQRLAGGSEANLPDGEGDSQEDPHLPLPAGGTDVIRVKGAGIDIVTMGVSGSAHRPEGSRRVSLDDPDGARYLEVVVADSRVIGATCIGGGRVASDLVAAYTRGTLVPADPAQLLIRPVAGSAVVAESPTRMPDRAVLCRCNSVTKGQIVSAWRGGARDLKAVASCTRATTGCGGCGDAVTGILEWLAASDPDRDAAEAAA